jgi:hypothetical protein
MCDVADESEIAKAWSLRRISIVNAATVTGVDDGHNYRQFVAGALREFARQWAAHPHRVAQEFGQHTCTRMCRMFEFVPPGRCSGDVFICWTSGNIHICTKDLCRYTEPQHGFPGFNNARRAVCHVCALTQRVFSVNPDQSAGGGAPDEDDDVDAGAGGISEAYAGGSDGGRVLVEYESDADADAAAQQLLLLPTPPPVRPKRKPAASCGDAHEPSSKRKRATAAAAAGPAVHSVAQRPILHGKGCEHRERRIRIYAAVASKLMPDAPTDSVNAWVHTMEHVWAIIQRSPGFERNNSQLQPKLFALVCLNYMRNIGLSTKTLAGARLVRVLPPVAYIRAHMADIKQIGEHGFTQAERALMCCMNELTSDDKIRLEFNDKIHASFCSFCSGFLVIGRVPLGVYAVHKLGVCLRPQHTRQMQPGGGQCYSVGRARQKQLFQIGDHPRALVACAARSNRQWTFHLFRHFNHKVKQPRAQTNADWSGQQAVDIGAHRKYWQARLPRLVVDITGRVRSANCFDQFREHRVSSCPHATQRLLVTTDFGTPNFAYRVGQLATEQQETRRV